MTKRKKPKPKTALELDTDALRAAFGGSCYVCDTKKGLTWHHRWYNPGDPKYSTFPDTAQGHRDYLAEVNRQVRADPNQFMLLCHKHHHFAEQLLQWDRKKLERQLKIVRLTVTRFDGDADRRRSRVSPQLRGRRF